MYLSLVDKEILEIAQNGTGNIYAYTALKMAVRHRSKLLGMQMKYCLKILLCILDNQG